MTTADLLTHYETCDRKGFWSKDWQRRRLDATQFLREAIRAGVTENQREDFGEVAGEKVMELAVDPGMELPPTRPHLHASVIHHAALSDALTTALRKPAAPAWTIPPTAVVNGLPWGSSAFLDPSGTRLRRVALVTSWNDDRHYSEIQSWYGMGEVVAYGLPMTMAVLVLGQQRDGRRASPWTKGFLHPQNHKLRFRKRARVTHEVFSDKWEQVWREDRGEISTREWLGAMLEDDVLRDVCFTVDIPLPDRLVQERIQDIAARKLERLTKLTERPEASMSVCQRCPFKGCCHSETPYLPSEKGGFVRVPGKVPGIAILGQGGNPASS